MLMWLKFATLMAKTPLKGLVTQMEADSWTWILALAATLSPPTPPTLLSTIVVMEKKVTT